MSIVVYWLEWETEEPTSQIKRFEDTELSAALKWCEHLRDKDWVEHYPITHVVMSCEFSGSVGQAGVNSVENGKLPDGTDYDWKKRR